MSSLGNIEMEIIKLYNKAYRNAKKVKSLVAQIKREANEAFGRNMMRMRVRIESCSGER